MAAVACNVLCGPAALRGCEKGEARNQGSSGHDLLRDVVRPQNPENPCVCVCVFVFSLAGSSRFRDEASRPLVARPASLKLIGTRNEYANSHLDSTRPRPPHVYLSAQAQEVLADCLAHARPSSVAANNGPVGRDARLPPSKGCANPTRARSQRRRARKRRGPQVADNDIRNDAKNNSPARNPADSSPQLQHSKFSPSEFRRDGPEKESETRPERGFVSLCAREFPQTCVVPPFKNLYFIPVGRVK